jgi:hypothetical protein
MAYGSKTLVTPKGGRRKAPALRLFCVAGRYRRAITFRDSFLDIPALHCDPNQVRGCRTDNLDRWRPIGRKRSQSGGLVSGA